MFLLTRRTRGVVLIQQPAFCLRTATPWLPKFSTSSQRLEEHQATAMFRKAVQDHSGAAKPLQPNTSRLNTTAPPVSKTASPVAGAKRKFEMANAGQSNLGSLHNPVWIDENDFDDELDLDAPDPVPQSQKPTSTSPELPKFSRPSPAANGSSSQKVSAQATSQEKIKYPELPPVEESPPEPAPSSSVPIPWSSSPPSHFAPPPKRRTLPWLNNETDNDSKNQASPVQMKPATPAHTKPTLPWNKTASAVKEEQKELRRQNKKRQQEAEKPRMYRPPERVASLFLSDEQRSVLEAVVDKGKSIFFTGSAGTGKSVLMREIIKKLREKYRREPDRVAVTASTGLAACNIEGVTLHSFAGIGLGKESAQELVKKVMHPCGRVGDSL